MHIHPLITDAADLKSLCARLSSRPFVAIDTEFMRENTYYPELCLLQLASDEEAAAIDPLAPGMDLSPFLAMLDDETLLKLIHAGGQDLEIFYNLIGRTPSPMFDTQIAAMALGMGEQVSYANLVAHFTGHQIDKGARFTDWARRPLSDRQIEYAIGDVTHLAQLFPKMLAKLRKTGRGEWLDEEMARLGEASNYTVDPEKAWLRLKLPSRRADVLGRLKALAKWREEEAKSKNVPRGRIIKDETLADLAGTPPRDQADLGRVRGLSAAWASNAIGARLLDALAAAEPLPADEMPLRDAARPGLSTDAALIADLLKLLLKLRAKEAGVAPKLVAKGDELECLAGGQRDGLALLAGWRRQIFGDDALALVEGRLGFSVRAGVLRMTALDSLSPPELQTAPAPEEPDGAAAETPAPDSDAGVPLVPHRARRSSEAG